MTKKGQVQIGIIVGVIGIAILALVLLSQSALGSNVKELTNIKNEPAGCTKQKFFYDITGQFSVSDSAGIWRIEPEITGFTNLGFRALRLAPEPIDWRVCAFDANTGGEIGCDDGHADIEGGQKISQEIPFKISFFVNSCDQDFSGDIKLEAKIVETKEGIFTTVDQQTETTTFSVRDGRKV